MKKVTKEEFWNYFQDKKYTTEQGNIFHSDIFIINGEEVEFLQKIME